MKFTFYTFIFCFSLWSCNNQEKHSFHHDHSHDNESNVHMNETSFEGLVKTLKTQHEPNGKNLMKLLIY
jgi:hypothetical protein